MKKAKRVFLVGSVQGVFFKQFVKEQADKQNVKGYLRRQEDGKIEIFLEGDGDKVDAMVAICKRGPVHSNIRNSEEKEEHFQGFNEFKILNF